jgi:hypothetical protein
VTKAEGDYFYNFESEILPKITWEEMVKEGKIISVGLLIKILTEAEKFLVTAPGPNLEKRKVLVPEWLGYWTNFLKPKAGIMKLVASERLAAFDQVHEILTRRNLTNTGVLFVAGAEGHAGHVYALEEMSRSCFPVWVFEQDSYFKHKARPGPFLPLEVRLSMWCYDPRMGLVTVAPECLQEGDLNDHYKKLFDQTGADRCYADSLDPNALKKVRRGELGVNNLLRHVTTASSTDRVRRLMVLANEDRESDDGGYVFGGVMDPMQIRYPTFFETQDCRLDEVIFRP